MKINKNYRKKLQIYCLFDIVFFETIKITKLKKIIQTRVSKCKTIGQ